MASHKDANNSKKRTYDIHDNSKMCNEEGGNERFHMLLSTTYGLNNSHTKRLHMGLQTTNDGVFKPVVKLSGNNANGIYFDDDTWQEFLRNMGLMSAYLTGDNGIKPNPVIIKNIIISFTTAYGARSILVTYKENEEEHSMDNIINGLRRNKETTDSTPATKKRKTYAVAIVMQKITFQGLENIVKCVNAHLEHLQSLANNVNECARYLIKEIDLKLPRSYIDCDIIKLIFKGNYDEIERNVRTQISDLTFLDMYFNIIFLELTSLRFNEILHIIMSNRES